MFGGGRGGAQAYAHVRTGLRLCPQLGPWSARAPRACAWATACLQLGHPVGWAGAWGASEAELLSPLPRQILTQEDWNVVLYNGMASTSPWASLYFVALMTFGNYVLFNLLVAILVEGFQAEVTAALVEDADLWGLRKTRQGVVWVEED